MGVLKKNPASVRSDGSHKSASPDPVNPQFNSERVMELVAELEVPFHPALIEWRVTRTDQSGSRGEIVPYVGQRAYTDRLNEIFTPAGWTRKYTVHTSANFERTKDQKIVAKVFVTCDLIIHGIGSHSATGEEWAHNSNAGTSAEAQAFKRACSCFRLGRYLYYFPGVWVDLDERKQPKNVPSILDWATPKGWRQGLRPSLRGDQASSNVILGRNSKTQGPSQRDSNVSAEQGGMVQSIEAMAEALGRAMYRGLLKTVARAWNPSEICDTAILKNVLMSMQSAERGLHRLEEARERTRPETLREILGSFKLKSPEQIDNLETLRNLVLALEERADQAQAI